jgi:hypothetical protein
MVQALQQQNYLPSCSFTQPLGQCGSGLVHVAALPPNHTVSGVSQTSIAEACKTAHMYLPVAAAQEELCYLWLL